MWKVSSLEPEQPGESSAVHLALGDLGPPAAQRALSLGAGLCAKASSAHAAPADWPPSTPT